MDSPFTTRELTTLEMTRSSIGLFFCNNKKQTKKQKQTKQQKEVHVVTSTSTVSMCNNNFVYGLSAKGRKGGQYDSSN